MDLTSDEVERFWRNTEVVGKCREWRGTKPGHNGYGRVMIRGRREQAHRWAWEIYHGEPVPDDLLVCHHCDNPICVSPPHLFVGTAIDNNRDKILKGRAPNMRRVRPSGKLTDEQVAALRVLTDSGAILVHLARAMCVSTSAMARVANRKAYLPD